MADVTIEVDHLARIEGHGDLHLCIENGEVTECNLTVVEPARLFESMVVGRYFEEVPYIASRICGICSSSHVVTDILAIEHIFNVEVTERTNTLRELLVYGSYLQNHATHLFVFGAPDFLGYESVFPLAQTNKELFDHALQLKALGNELCTTVGGRSVHPITAVVGGFTSEPSSEDFLALADKLEAMIPFTEESVDLFAGFEALPLQTEGDFLAMVEPGAYPVCTSQNALFVRSDQEFSCQEVQEAIEEFSQDHSAAFLACNRATKKPYMTAALARINASWSNLGKTARFASAKAGLRPPELNPMANNLAQAVELVDVLERCAELCRNLAEPSFGGSSLPVEFEIQAGYGVGFTEAPRGSLFHCLELDENGRVVKASIITPTAQNLMNLEADMRQLAELMLERGATEDEIRLEAEKLVRAYDPCLSCSVH